MTGEQARVNEPWNLLWAEMRGYFQQAQAEGDDVVETAIVLRWLDEVRERAGSGPVMVAAIAEAAVARYAREGRL